MIYKTITTNPNSTSRMPNYVYNTLTLECDDPLILDRFYDENRKHIDPPKVWTDYHLQHILSFECQVPVANNESQTEKWGCKWDASSPEYTKVSTDKSEYKFTTAWSPPMRWLEKVSVIYPSIQFTIKYECEGTEFIGLSTVINGVRTVKFYYNWSDIPKYLKEQLKVNLVDIYNRITIKSEGDIKKLDLDDEGNNEILIFVIEELGLNKEFNGIDSQIMRNIYLTQRRRIEIDRFEYDFD